MPIIIDNRGSGEEEIANLLQKKNFLVKREHVDSGDIILIGPDTTIAIERKTVSDLLSSLMGSKKSWSKTNKHLWTQLETMKSTYKHNLVIIEGAINWSDPTQCGIMTSIIVDWGIPFLNTSSTKGTAETIAKLFVKYGNYASTRLPPPAVRKSKKMGEIKLAMLCCVEGLGIATAKKLVEAEPLLISTVLGEEYVQSLLQDKFKGLKDAKLVEKRLLSVLYNIES